MDNRQDERRGRLRFFINSLGVKDKSFAQSIGAHPTVVSQILNGHNTLTPTMAHRIGEVYPNLNKDWLLEGRGEMLLEDGIEEEPSPHVPKEGEPSMEDVERLRVAVLERYKPEPPLSVRQDLTFRQACYKALTDNPGTSWALVVAVAGAYLQVIQGNPGIVIPTQGLPPMGGS